MKEYWNKLSFKQKVSHIFWSVVGVLILIFALLNWDVYELNLIFGSVDVPVTILIFISMFGGYGYAKLFGYINSRQKDKEINYLKGELASLRHKQTKLDQAPSPSSKKIPKSK